MSQFTASFISLPFSVSDLRDIPCWDPKLKVDHPHGSLGTASGISYVQLNLKRVKESV